MNQISEGFKENLKDKRGSREQGLIEFCRDLSIACNKDTVSLSSGERQCFEYKDNKWTKKGVNLYSPESLIATISCLKCGWNIVKNSLLGKI